ncbi:MAG: hypothetical protein QMD03_08020 [Syntrophales bacterium]|nr:hypothetical protein [Syntrophales bacterium]
MKKDNIFDAVKMMRDIRDRMSEEMKGMTPKQQIEYIERKSGLRREGKKRTVTASNSG